MCSIVLSGTSTFDDLLKTIETDLSYMQNHFVSNTQDTRKKLPQLISNIERLGVFYPNEKTPLAQMADLLEPSGLSNEAIKSAVRSFSQIRTRFTAKLQPRDSETSVSLASTTSSSSAFALAANTSHSQASSAAMSTSPTNSIAKDSTDLRVETVKSLIHQLDCLRRSMHGTAQTFPKKHASHAEFRLAVEYKNLSLLFEGYRKNLSEIMASWPGIALNIEPILAQLQEPDYKGVNLGRARDLLLSLLFNLTPLCEGLIPLFSEMESRSSQSEKLSTDELIQHVQRFSIRAKHLEKLFPSSMVATRDLIFISLKRETNRSSVIRNIKYALELIHKLFPVPMALPVSIRARSQSVTTQSQAQILSQVAQKTPVSNSSASTTASNNSESSQAVAPEPALDTMPSEVQHDSISDAHAVVTLGASTSQTPPQSSETSEATAAITITTSALPIESYPQSSTLEAHVAVSMDVDSLAVGALSPQPLPQMTPPPEQAVGVSKQVPAIKLRYKPWIKRNPKTVEKFKQLVELVKKGFFGCHLQKLSKEDLASNAGVIFFIAWMMLENRPLEADSEPLFILINEAKLDLDDLRECFSEAIFSGWTEKVQESFTVLHKQLLAENEQNSFLLMLPLLIQDLLKIFPFTHCLLSPEKIAQYDVLVEMLNTIYEDFAKDKYCRELAIEMYPCTFKGRAALFVILANNRVFSSHTMSATSSPFINAVRSYVRNDPKHVDKIKTLNASLLEEAWNENIQDIMDLYKEVSENQLANVLDDWEAVVAHVASRFNWSQADIKKYVDEMHRVEDARVLTELEQGNYTGLIDCLLEVEMPEPRFNLILQKSAAILHDKSPQLASDLLRMSKVQTPLASEEEVKVAEEESLETQESDRLLKDLLTKYKANEARGKFFPFGRLEKTSWNKRLNETFREACVSLIEGCKNTGRTDLLLIIWRQAPNMRDPKLIPLLVEAFEVVDPGFASALKGLPLIMP